MPTELRGRRVVVTGGAGFIGVHSVEALVDAGASVLVIDDLRHASYRPLPASARLEVADIADAPARNAQEKGWLEILPLLFSCQMEGLILALCKACLERFISSET